MSCNLQYFDGSEWIYCSEWFSEESAWLSLNGDDLNYRTVDDSGKVLTDKSSNQIPTQKVENVKEENTHLRKEISVDEISNLIESNIKKLKSNEIDERKFKRDIAGLLVDVLRVKIKVPQKSRNTSLWDWFGLSYASFLTLPRVLMHGMADEWQNKMAKLLYEYDDVYGNLPELDTRVQAVKNGRMVKLPKELLNYRHPNLKIIESFKSKPDYKTNTGDKEKANV